MKFTAAGVEALKGTGKIKSEAVAAGGSLVARGLTSSVRFYFEYRDSESRKQRVPFGDYNTRGDSKGSADSTEFTLIGARLRAVALSATQKEQGDLIGYIREQRLTATEAVQNRIKAREQRNADTRDYSLARLCVAYSEHLQNEGKASASTVRNALKRWVIDRHPATAGKKASDVTTADIMEILRDVIDQGHSTMTNRLRSYLSAAYGFGIGSATDPLSNSKAQGFRLTGNPVAAIKPVQRFEKQGERALSVNELSELLRRLTQQNTPAAKAVLLALRLGGQRVTQLLAVTPNRLNADVGTVVIDDPKGRRLKPRKHILPIVDAAKPILFEALAIQHPRRSGLWAGLSIHTVSKLVVEISRGMVADGVAEPFTLRDLRRTCETRLAAMGVSKDLRAQLQSHGLNGVQDKHYDRHDYLDEKRNALEAWNAHIDQYISGELQPDNVSSLADHR